MLYLKNILLFCFVLSVFSYGVSPVPADQKTNVLVVVPGFGYGIPRTEMLVKSLEHLFYDKTVDKDCMIFVYNDLPVVEENKVGDAKLRDLCAFVPFNYANYGDFVKAVPPFLVQKGGYTHVMILLDDVDLEPSFVLHEFLAIMERNKLSIASPAMHGAQHWTTKAHDYDHKDYAIGHQTHTIEVFATVFTMEGYNCFYSMVEPMVNSVGWAYDVAMYAFCHTRIPNFAIGVVDKMRGRHMSWGKINTKPFKPQVEYAVNSLPGTQKDNWSAIMLKKYNVSVLKEERYFFGPPLV